MVVPRHRADGNLQQKWWYLGTEGDKSHVAAHPNGITYSSPYGPKLHVRFVEPAEVKVETRDATGTGPIYNRAALRWQEAGMPVESGKGTSIRVRQTTSVTAFGPIAAGQDITVVLVPTRGDEPLPEIERLDNGLVRIRSATGTDYVFARNRSARAKSGDVTFSGLAGVVRVFDNEAHLAVAEGPGAVSYRTTMLRSEVPVTRVIPTAQLKAGVIEVKAPRHSITLVPGGIELNTTSPGGGVREVEFPGGRGFVVDEPKHASHRSADGSFAFDGRKGAVYVNNDAGTTRMVVLDGNEIRFGGLLIWGGGGPYDVTFHNDRITGRTAGVGRFLLMTRPPGLDRLPMYVLDGQTYAPGTSGNTLIVPVLDGEHEFEIRVLPQPPIWRNWQAWE